MRQSFLGTHPRSLCRLVCTIGILALAACRAEPEPEPEARPSPVPQDPAPAPTRSFAHPEIKAEMLADLETVRSPSDGGGRAWVEGYETPGVRPTVRASSRAQFPIVFEAGPLGVAEGGMVFFQASPFWGWDTPQVLEPTGPGYTEVDTDAAGVTLLPRTLGPQLLGIEIQGRGLEPGERIHINYGAGAARAKVDRFAESDSKLWIAVDGDGDGVRKLIADSPGVDVQAGPPAILNVALPGTSQVGSRVPLTVAVLDAAGNMGAPFVGDVDLELVSEDAAVPASKVSIGADDQGRRTIDFPVDGAGLFRVRARATTPEGRTLEAESNPMLVAESLPATLLWGDLQGHTQLSDGSATPAEYFEYGRDAAGLDFVAVTDHDHWGLQALDTNPTLWERTIEDVRRFHDPGRFVALLGFEWTNWVEGHRHVVHFGENEEDLRVLSSLAPESDTPQELWAGLRGQPVLTIAHHSAGGPVPIDWSIPPDPILEPVTEVASVHGSSEAPDSPMPIYNAKPGNYVRDALDMGYRLGMGGGSDGHDGHPGLSQIAAGKSGVAAVWTDPKQPRTRAALLDALRSRRTYATNGPRILVQASLDGRPMGSEVPPGGEADSVHRLAWNVAGTGPIERIDVIRRGNEIVTVPVDGQWESTGVAELPGLEVGDYLYLRIVQEDGGTAWTSPFFIQAPPSPEQSK